MTCRDADNSIAPAELNPNAERAVIALIIQGLLYVATARGMIRMTKVRPADHKIETQGLPLGYHSISAPLAQGTEHRETTVTVSHVHCAT
jgi:hypothetical protein